MAGRTMHEVTIIGGNPSPADSVAYLRPDRSASCFAPQNVVWIGVAVFRAIKTVTENVSAGIPIPSNEPIEAL